MIHRFIRLFQTGIALAILLFLFSCDSNPLSPEREMVIEPVLAPAMLGTYECPIKYCLPDVEVPISPSPPDCDMWWTPDCGVCMHSVGDGGIGTLASGDEGGVTILSCAPGGGGGYNPGDPGDPIGGGGGDRGGGGFVIPWEDHDEVELPDTLPLCPVGRNRHERAYCQGQPPAGLQLTRINQSLDRMTARGGVCAILAAKGRILLQKGHLRIFTYNPSVHSFAGHAPRNGQWMILASLWLDETRHNAYGPGIMGLDFALAHELDHHNGEYHIGAGTPDVDRYRTPNTEACSGLIPE